MLQINEEMTEIISSMFESVKKLEIEYPHLAKALIGNQEKKRLDQLLYATAMLQYDYKNNKLDIDFYINSFEGEGLLAADIMISSSQGIQQFRIQGKGERFARSHASIHLDKNEKDVPSIYINALFSNASGMVVGRHIEPEIQLCNANVIEDIQLVHPLSNSKIVNIAYWLANGDYNYDGNSEGYVMIPAMVLIKLDCTDTQRDIDTQSPIHCILTIIGADGEKYSIEKNDTSFAKFVNQKEWEQIKKKSIYPPLYNIPEKYYALLLPINWDILFNNLRVGMMQSPYTFSAQIDYAYKEKNEIFHGKFYMQSVMEPKPYRTGENRIETKLLNIKYDCIDVLASVIVKRGNCIYNECLKNIKQGDYIYDRRRKEGYAVLKIQSCVLTGTVYIHTSIAQLTLSYSHPVMSKDGWKEAINLTDSDSILCSDGLYYKIDNIKVEKEKEIEVCNLVIDGTHHSLFVNELQIGDAQQNEQIIKKLDAIPVDKNILQDVANYVNK